MPAMWGMNDCSSGNEPKWRNRMKVTGTGRTVIRVTPGVAFVLGFGVACLIWLGWLLAVNAAINNIWP